MIRADWTPLWAADWSTRKRLGAKQVACLEALRERGELTRRELIQTGISRHTLDTLVLSGFIYPHLVMFREHPDGRQRYYLAAPGQQEALERALAVLAAHPEGITWDQLAKAASREFGDAVVWHVYGAGLARYQHDQYLIPPAPGEQQELMLPAARETARAMAEPPQIGAAA
jgi:hypothetical protein